MTRIGATLLATVAVLFADVYSDTVGTMIRERRRMKRGEVIAMTAELGSLMLAAVRPLALMLRAAIGVISVSAAAWSSVWSLVALLFAFGFAAAPWGRRFGHRQCAERGAAGRRGNRHGAVQGCGDALTAAGRPTGRPGRSSP
jgi:hypothetical protein